MKMTIQLLNRLYSLIFVGRTQEDGSEQQEHKGPSRLSFVRGGLPHFLLVWPFKRLYIRLSHTVFVGGNYILFV